MADNMRDKGPSIKYVRKIFWATNISNLLIRTSPPDTHSPPGTCAYQGVRDVSFSENVMYGLNG